MAMKTNGEDEMKWTDKLDIMQEEEVEEDFRNWLRTETHRQRRRWRRNEGASLLDAY